ncbi:MAG: hypothetical protein JST55_11000 [Bacteroidetes bacterium]|nr:hypothetical protein [Bacteroidota bacterium]
MKASLNLYNLIKSLTKSEKRYFNLNYLQKSDDKNYGKLFKEIELQSVKVKYDEEEIKRKFKNELFIKQLTFTKNYLHNLIVKSLISFYSKNNLESELYNLILASKIFFKKSLFDDYFIALEKAKILAERTEKFGTLIEVIKQQMKLVRLKSRKKYKRRNLYNEEQEAIKKIENISAYSKLLNTFYSITKIPDYARSKILYKEALKIFDNKLLSSEKYALSETAKDLYYLLLLYKNELLENNAALFEISGKRYESYRRNKDVFKSDPEDKDLSLSYNLLHYSLIAGKIIFFNSAIKEFEYKFINEKNLAVQSESNYFYLQLLSELYYKQNKMKECLSFADKVFDYLRSDEAIQNKDELLSYYFTYAKINFECKNYLKALEVLGIIITHEYKDVRYDILSYAHFLELFIHYELKNYQLVSSYIRSLTRKLSIHKEKDLSEKIILNFFSELISENKIDEEYVLKKYYKKFQLLKKNKYERVFYNELPIDKWIAKKIS